MYVMTEIFIHQEGLLIDWKCQRSLYLRCAGSLIPLTGMPCMINSLTAMFVTFREGFEAVFLTMLMLGASRTQGVRNAVSLIGIAVGLLLSLGLVGAMHILDVSSESVVPVMYLCTALVLTYVVVWNARVTRHINEHLREMRNRSMLAMLFTVTTIYFREGAEMAFMLYGSFSTDPLGSALGMGIGLVLLAATVYLVRRKVSSRLDPKTLFAISNIILGVLALYFYAEFAEYLLDSNIIALTFQ